jgi:hypothetical protein
MKTEDQHDVELQGRLIASIVANDAALHLSAEQCAARYYVTSRRWLGMVKQGRLPPPVSIDGSIRWRVADLVRFDLESTKGSEAWQAFEQLVRPMEPSEL